MLILILLLGGLGLDVYVWHQYRINYAFIFSLNPRLAALCHSPHLISRRNAVSYNDLFDLSGLLGVLWCVFVVLYIFSPSLGINITIGSNNNGQ
jgi:hypothetical protein